MMLRTGNKPMGGILSLRESSSSLIVIISSKFPNSISFCLQVPLQFYMNKANSKAKSSEICFAILIFMYKIFLIAFLANHTILSWVLYVL